MKSHNSLHAKPLEQIIFHIKKMTDRTINYLLLNLLLLIVLLLLNFSTIEIAIALIGLSLITYFLSVSSLKPQNNIPQAQENNQEKEMQQALLKSEKRYAKLFMSAPASIAIVRGEEHIYEMANPLYLQLIGKTNIIGKSVKEVLPELKEQGFFDLLNTVYRTGKPFSASEKHIKLFRNGSDKLTDVYINIIYEPHRNAEDVVDSIFLFAVDVTEQVIARKTIEESEKRYREIVETAEEGIWLVNENNQTLFVNSKMAQILEYSNEEMMGKQCFYFMDDDAKIISSQNIEKRKTNKSKFNYEIWLITKSGKKVWTHLSTSPILSADGTYKGALAMVTDITERKLSEEQLRLKKRAIECAIEGVIITDSRLPDNPIIYVNSGFCKTTGYTPEEVIGKNSRFMQGKDTNPITAMEIRTAVSKNTHYEGEIINYKKDGTPFWNFLRIAPITDDNGQTTHYVAFQNDISDKKLVELELDKMLEELEIRIDERTRELSVTNDVLRSEIHERVRVGHELQKKNKDITDSIRYAKRIQESMLPDKRELKKHFPHSLIIYKPKDIISGDFYWFTEYDNRFYLAIADCTGHGVPGSLMSMMGFNFLDEIVSENHITNVGEILKRLNNYVLKSLKQDKSEIASRDGMDIAICAFDKSANLIHYAGANRHLYLFKQNQLQIIKADKFGIGGYQTSVPKEFSSHTVSFEKGDSVYIFTDGIVDQFGGPKDKKLMTRNLTDFIQSNLSQSMFNQEKIIDAYFDSWKGTTEQTDDVLLIGIRY